MQIPTTCLINYFHSLLHSAKRMIFLQSKSHYFPYIKLLIASDFSYGEKKSKFLTWCAASIIPAWSIIPCLSLQPCYTSCSLILPLLWPHIALSNSTVCQCARAGVVIHLPNLLISSNFSSDCSSLTAPGKNLVSLLWLSHNAEHNPGCLGNNIFNLLIYMCDSLINICQPSLDHGQIYCISRVSHMNGT